MTATKKHYSVTYSGIVSSGKTWERRSQSCFKGGAAFKPSLGELFASKFAYFRVKIGKKSSRHGT